MKKLKYQILSFIYTFSPALSLAQSLNLPGSTFYDVMDYIYIILTTLNPILFSLVFVVFFWGLSKFVLNSGNKDEIEKGKKYMVWGVFVLFILVSFRAIISFVTSDLGLGDSTNLPIIRQATP